MSMPAVPLRVWHMMKPREQAVWGAAYALHLNPSLEAAVHADQVVGTLSEVEYPETEAPEHRAARLISGLSFDEFRGWYLVEQRAARHRQRRLATSEADIQKAFEIYVLCSCDFY